MVRKHVENGCSRRDALLGLAAAGGARAAARKSGIHAGCQTNAWPVKPPEFSTLLAALAGIRELGFAGFETGFRNVEPHFDNAAAVRPQLLQGGLTFFGVHIFLNEYDPATRIAPAALAKQVADGGAALGAQRLIVSGAPCSNGSLVFDASALRRKADALNTIGEHCRRAGLGLAYHNHGPEFARDAEEIRALLSQTDPQRVQLVMDAGHAFAAGADVPGFVRQHHARLAGMHLRDFRNGSQVPLGQGGFPLAQVAQALQQVRWQGWVLAEEERLDGSKPGRSAAGPARQSIRQAFGI